jgi:hypothetical protein
MNIIGLKITLLFKWNPKRSSSENTTKVQRTTEVVQRTQFLKEHNSSS